MRRPTIRALILAAVSASSAAAQTVDDGLMIPKRTFVAGVLYAQDSWDQYWEGTLRRTNGNIGTVTTRSLTFASAYGVTERLSVIAALPYVWTSASEGTLSGSSGIQDVTVAAKYRLLTAESSRHGAVSAFLVGAVSLPMSNYTPDYLPLSIGYGDGRATGRLTVDYQSTSPWFMNASAAYTWCSNVTLDRVSYYTDGQLYLTNKVAIPNVVSYALGTGYRGGRLRIPFSLVQQRTLGGGDIRRQDMPFVSNRMDYTRIDGGVIYALDVPSNVTVRLGAAHVLNGRNVGQSTTLTSGVFYALHF